MATRDPAGYEFMLTRLKQARDEAGLSQVEVAAALNIPQQHVSRVENGDRRIDPLELLEFAKLYEKDVTHFLPKDGSIESVTSEE